MGGVEARRGGRVGATLGGGGGGVSIGIGVGECSYVGRRTYLFFLSAAIEVHWYWYWYYDCYYYLVSRSSQSVSLVFSQSVSQVSQLVS